MGLIINKAFPMFMVGYPTVSDKYNAQGGILSGSNATEFGKLVCFGSTAGYYEAFTGTKTLEDIAGIVLATNVKVANEWPAKTVTVEPGEAFNLLLDGFIAVELSADAVESNIKAGKPVAVKLEGGLLTTSGVSAATDLPGYEFTGLYGKNGATIVAEIRVK